MSRIGRMPITVPAGVTVTVAADNVVTVKGPLGTLTNKFNNRMTIAQEGNVITVTRPLSSILLTLNQKSKLGFKERRGTPRLSFFVYCNSIGNVLKYKRNV